MTYSIEHTKIPAGVRVLVHATSEDAPELAEPTEPPVTGLTEQSGAVGEALPTSAEIPAAAVEPEQEIDEHWVASIVPAKAERNLKMSSLAAKNGPLYKDKMSLPPEIEALGIDERPMIWRDLSDFAARHARTVPDMVYDFALLSTNSYCNKVPLRTVVPFDVELLARLYDQYPSSCPWIRPGTREMFDLMYDDHLKTFPRQYESSARLATGRRYTKMFGRVDTAQYRWLESNNNTTRRLSNILGKLKDIHSHDLLTGRNRHPRFILECVSSRIWDLRCFDIEKYFPLPTLETVTRPSWSHGRKTINPIQPRPTDALSKITYEGGVFE